MGNSDIYRPLRSYHLLTSLEGRETGVQQNIFIVSDGHWSDHATVLQAAGSYSQLIRVFTLGIRFGYVCISYFNSFLYFVVRTRDFVIFLNPLLAHYNALYNFVSGLTLAALQKSQCLCPCHSCCHFPHC